MTHEQANEYAAVQMLGKTMKQITLPAVLEAKSAKQYDRLLDKNFEILDLIIEGLPPDKPRRRWLS